MRIPGQDTLLEAFWLSLDSQVRGEDNSATIITALIASVACCSEVSKSPFVVANIPFAETGLGTPGLTFPGQYLVAVDSQGNADNGTLNVTRGSVVWSMTGFAIVQPDST